MFNWIKDKLNKGWEWTKRNVKKVLIGIGILGVATAITIPLIPDRVPDIVLERMTEKYNQAQEIQAKYQMEGASLKRIAKADPKDRIEVIVGGKDEFKPRLEIQRWDNEVSFSVELKDTETGNPTLDFVGDKIKWSKGNIEIEYYDYEDGYKMVWFLKEKPLTNKIEFILESKDAVFYYQPELTQEEKDNGDIRPENVVGSYAVYAETPKTNWVGGKEYKAGKIGHIYRPKLIDAEGKEEWGILHIENGIYSVEIPQKFLDKAVYPIKSNDFFGFNAAGGVFLRIATSTGNLCERVGVTANLSEAGTLDKITANLKTSANEHTLDVQTSINREDSAGANSHDRVAAVERTSITVGSTAAWFEFTYSSEELTADDYILSAIGDGNDMSGSFQFVNLTYDTAGEQNWYNEAYDTDYAGGKAEDPWTQAEQVTTNRQYSIYATYTPAGAERRIIIIE